MSLWAVKKGCKAGSITVWRVPRSSWRILLPSKEALVITLHVCVVVLALLVKATHCDIVQSSWRVNKSSSNLKRWTIMIASVPDLVKCIISTYFFRSEKLNTEVSSSSWSSMRSLAWVCRPFSSLLNSDIRFMVSCLGQLYFRHWLVSKRFLSVANMSPKRVRSSEITSPFACTLGPILCLPSATRFLRFDHLKKWMSIIKCNSLIPNLVQIKPVWYYQE